MEEDTWGNLPLRISYTSLAFALMALAISYFGSYLWLTIPFVVIGIGMFVLDVKKYRMRRAHISERDIVRSLKWNLTYDLVNSTILMSITVALLLLKYDSLTVFIVLLLWVVFGRSFQKQLNERVPLVEQSEEGRQIR
ncbi:hypothetical protein A6395_10260 [Exiguobacterium sp. SH31]|nr:hypothetical protein A6395_10260 [Exiguobacterium sp. SH31]